MFTEALRHSCVLASIAVGSILLSCQRKDPSEVTPPSRIVLVTIDTLRGDHVSFAGYFRKTTPFLDELAEDGTVFTSCISASSLTGPSHASMLSGVFPPQHGILTNEQSFDPNQEVLTAALADAGWQSAAFTGVRFLKQLDLGFEQFHEAPQRYRDAVTFRGADETVDAVLEWWRSPERDPARSTFLWVHFFDVHEYQENPVDPALARSDQAAEDALAKQLRAHLRSEMPYLKPHVATIDRYDSRILEVDRALRRLHGEIEGESSGDSGTGLWIFTSDHGEGLGTHGEFDHGRLIYDEQLRVPLLVHSSDGRFAGERIDELVRTVDLAPTIAEAAGASFSPRPLNDPRLDARPLQPLLAGDRGELGRIAFALRRPSNENRVEHGWEEGILAAARTLRFKLIQHSHGDDELFDLRDDPGELHNLLPDNVIDRTALEMLREALSAVMRAAGADAARSDTFLEELEQLGYLK